MDDQNQQDLNQQPEAQSENPTANSEGKLDSVKGRILEALTPLIKEVDMPPEQKFDICLSALRLANNKDIAEDALDAALSIEESGPKAEALVSLLYEVNYLQQN